jgi:hypothetical protein
MDKNEEKWGEKKWFESFKKTVYLEGVFTEGRISLVYMGL